MRADHERRGAVGAGSVALGAAFLFATLNLRPAIAAVSPILPTIRHAEGLSPAAAGVLTSMPLVCFGAAAFFTPRIVRRRGAGGVMLACLFALVCGILVRSLPALWTLFAGTFVIGVSAGICNVLMPGVVKKDFPRHVALMTGLYTTMLSLGPSAGAGATAPLDHALGGDWRAALGCWAIPVAVALACWLPFRRHDLPGPPDSADWAPRAGGLWRSGTAWSISLFMGLQALNFYTVLTWLPTILQGRGMTVVASGTLLAVLNVVAISASLLAPVLSQRFGSQWAVAIISAVLNAGGTCGLLVDGHHLQLLWVILIGLGQGSAISLALMMIVVKSADSGQATTLSGMAQGVGYLLAAGGPVAAGALFNVSRGWAPALIGLIALLGLQAAVAWRAGRHPSLVAAPDRPSPV